MVRYWGLVGLSIFLIGLSQTSSTALAGECPPSAVPSAAPHEKLAPESPPQIKDVRRVHYTNTGPDTGDGYCLYVPESNADGLILYVHGYQPSWSAHLVNQYDAMFQYFAKSGFYVAYPYMDPWFAEFRYPDFALAALNRALSKLQAEGIQIDKLAVAGHSLGAIAVARVAAMWKEQGRSPAIRAVVLHDPAGLRPFPDMPFPPPTEWIAKLGAIPCDTNLLIIQAQTCASPEAVNCAAIPIWRNLPQIAKYIGTSGAVSKRNVLRVSDDTSHANMGPGGEGITLPSTHLAPTVLPAPPLCEAPQGGGYDYGCYLTSIDYWGYWRPTLAAVSEAFTGNPVATDYSPYCSSADTTGTCAKTRDMGIWLDGVAATPMKNAAEIPELATNYPDYCER